MHQLTSVPNIAVPADTSFLQWLDEEGLTEAVVQTVTNLRRYFKDEEILLEQDADPEALEVVKIVVRPTPIESEEPYQTLTRFDEEWWFHQHREIYDRIGVHLG